MVRAPAGQNIEYSYGLTFNIDGKELYSLAAIYNSGSYGVLPIDLSDNMPGTIISLNSNAVIPNQQNIAASPDPVTGKPVVNVPWTDRQHLYVSVIDGDSGSPTFNTIIRTFDTGIYDPNSGLSLDLMTVGPDGKFAYLWYDDYVSRDIYYGGILDLTTGKFRYATADELGVYPYQAQASISPDGKSLLLATYRGSKTRIKVFDLSDPTNPKPMNEITPAPISGHGIPQVFYYQVVGNQLYAFDGGGLVVVFNFNRGTGDFRERGWYYDPAIGGYPAFSADGAYLYATDFFNDQVSVFDTSKLFTGKGALLTNLRVPWAPNVVAVSPVAPPQKLTLENRHTAALGVRR